MVTRARIAYGSAFRTLCEGGRHCLGESKLFGGELEDAFVFLVAGAAHWLEHCCLALVSAGVALAILVTLIAEHLPRGIASLAVRLRWVGWQAGLAPDAETGDTRIPISSLCA